MLGGQFRSFLVGPPPGSARFPTIRNPFLRTVAHIPVPPFLIRSPCVPTVEGSAFRDQPLCIWEGPKPFILVPCRRCFAIISSPSICPPLKSYRRSSPPPDMKHTAPPTSRGKCALRPSFSAVDYCVPRAWVRLVCVSAQSVSVIHPF